MTQTVDLAAVKAKQRSGWQSGDYPRVGNTLQIIAEQIVVSAGVHAGDRVLDVASGQGNAALAAARRFAEATGVDYATNLLEQGVQRAQAEQLPVTFTEGDAEDLPFPDDSFDITLSTVGVMFAPNQEKAAAELVRVTRPGGRIALASWTPQSLVGSLFRTIGRYAPPPPGVSSPMLWGTPERLTELCGDAVQWTALETRQFEFCYRSAEHFADWFCRFYGPMTALSSTMDEQKRTEFEHDIAQAVRAYDIATDGTFLAPSDYLEAVGVVQ